MQGLLLRQEDAALRCACCRFSACSSTAAPPPAESASSQEPSPNLQQQLQQVAAAAAAVDPELAAESGLRFPLPPGAARQPQTGAAEDGVPGESSLTNLGDSALLQPYTAAAAPEQQQMQLDTADEQQQVQLTPAEAQQEAPAAQTETRGPRHKVSIFQSADAEACAHDEPARAMCVQGI